MSNKDQQPYDFIVLLMISYRFIMDELHLKLTAAGYDDVRPAHGFVFQLLSKGGATGKEIAEHLSISKQAASQIIDYLEHKGYIKRDLHPQDARAKWIQLTDKGWDCIRQTEVIFGGVEARFSEMMGKEKMGHMIQDFQKFVLSISEGNRLTPFRPVW